MFAPSQHTGAVAGEDAGLRQLPEGWVWTRMGNVATIVGGGTPSTSDSANFENGEIPWITPADLSGYADKFISRGARNITERGLKKSSARILPRESVLMSSRAPIGYVAIASVSLATNQGFKSFILPSGIDSNFVYYLLLRSREEIQALGVGTTFKEVSATKAATIPLPLPPLPEQHRIVAEIEKQFTRLDASVAALKRVQANMKRYRASVLKAACEGKLVPTEAELAEAEGRDYEPADRLLERILAERRARWESQENRRGKYKEPIAPDTSDLPGSPEGWVWSRFDQVVSTLEGGTAVSATNTRSNRPVLRSSAVRQGLVDYEDFRYLPDGANQGPDPYIAVGDLLFTRLSGTLEYVGNCAVVEELRGRKIEFPDRIFRGRCVSGISPNFVQLAFAEKTMRRSLESKAKSSAGHQRISLSDLREYCVPLPPFAEQGRIVTEVERRLSVIQQAEAAVEASLTRAERMRQSILKQAFSGKLVPQDPNDEPASVLLERIRAEREAAQASAELKARAKRRGASSSYEKQLLLGVQEKTS